MNAKETKSFRVRLISVFLAAMVLIACLPSVIFASADSTSTYQNPLVLTNASVEFRDNKFQPIDEAESGAMFYLMATISGNNYGFESASAELCRKRLHRRLGVQRLHPARGKGCER